MATISQNTISSFFSPFLHSSDLLKLHGRGEGTQVYTGTVSPKAETFIVGRLQTNGVSGGGVHRHLKMRVQSSEFWISV